jgi:hypothetical protein
VCLGGEAGPESDRGLKRNSDKKDQVMVRADGANIEEAVRTRVLEQSAKDAKARNSRLEPEVIEGAIDETLRMTRSGNAVVKPESEFPQRLKPRSIR